MVCVWCHLERNHWLNPNLEPSFTMGRHHLPDSKTLPSFTVFYQASLPQHHLCCSLGELRYHKVSSQDQDLHVARSYRGTWCHGLTLSNPDQSMIPWWGLGPGFTRAAPEVHDALQKTSSGQTPVYLPVSLVRARTQATDVTLHSLLQQAPSPSPAGIHHSTTNSHSLNSQEDLGDQ